MHKAFARQPVIQEVRQPWFANPDAVQDLFESFEVEVAAVLAVACMLIEFFKSNDEWFSMAG